MTFGKGVVVGVGVRNEVSGALGVKRRRLFEADFTGVFPIMRDCIVVEQ